MRSDQLSDLFGKSYFLVHITAATWMFYQRSHSSSWDHCSAFCSLSPCLTFEVLLCSSGVEVEPQTCRSTKELWILSTEVVTNPERQYFIVKVVHNLWFSYTQVWWFLLKFLCLFRGVYITVALKASQYNPFCWYIFALLTKILVP